MRWNRIDMMRRRPFYSYFLILLFVSFSVNFILLYSIRNYSEITTLLRSQSGVETATDVDAAIIEQLLFECVQREFSRHYRYFRPNQTDPLVKELQVDLVAKLLCLSGANLSKAFYDKIIYQAPALVAKVGPSLSERCAKAPRIFFSKDIFRTGSGFGSRFHMLGLAVNLINTFDHPFRVLAIEKGGWIYADKEKCKKEDYRCFLQDITACHVGSEYSSYHFTPYFSLDGWRNRVETVQMLHNDHKLTLSFGRSLPLKYQEKGWLWYYSQVFAFLLQPKDFVVELVQKTKRDINFKKPAIAMHIRHGDKTIEDSLYQLNKYMRYAEIFREIYNVTNIFLLTDDPAVIEEAESLRPLYNFMYTNYQRMNGAATANLQKKVISAHEESLNLLKELYIASECDYFIGTFSSGWSRTVFKFMNGMQGRIVPHFSLSEWGFDQNGVPDDEYRIFQYE